MLGQGSCADEWSVARVQAGRLSGRLKDRAMLDWFKRTFPGTGHRHFALMLEGSYTREQREEWLHKLRVQVISFGPTHAALADKIKELNPNSEKAKFRRVRLLNQLKQRGSPSDIPEFVSIAKGAGASAAATRACR